MAAALDPNSIMQTPAWYRQHRASFVFRDGTYIDNNDWGALRKPVGGSTPLPTHGTPGENSMGALTILTNLRNLIQSPGMAWFSWTASDAQRLQNLVRAVPNNAYWREVVLQKLPRPPSYEEPPHPRPQNPPSGTSVASGPALDTSKAIQSPAWYQSRRAQVVFGDGSYMLADGSVFYPPVSGFPQDHSHFEALDPGRLVDMYSNRRGGVIWISDAHRRLLDRAATVRPTLPPLATSAPISAPATDDSSLKELADLERFGQEPPPTSRLTEQQKQNARNAYRAKVRESVKTKGPSALDGLPRSTLTTEERSSALSESTQTNQQILENVREFGPSLLDNLPADKRPPADQVALATQDYKKKVYENVVSKGPGIIQNLPPGVLTEAEIQEATSTYQRNSRNSYLSSADLTESTAGGTLVSDLEASQGADPAITASADASVRLPADQVAQLPIGNTISKAEKRALVQGQDDEGFSTMMTTQTVVTPPISDTSREVDQAKQKLLNDQLLVPDYFRDGKVATERLPDGSERKKWEINPMYLSEDDFYSKNNLASIKLVQGGKEITPTYNKFFLESVTVPRSERYQFVETFGDWYVFFYGESPSVYTFTGILLNAPNHNWLNEFDAYYDGFLRGTRAAANRSRAHLLFGFQKIEGFLLSFGYNIESSNPKMARFSMQVAVAKRAILPRLGATLEDSFILNSAEFKKRLSPGTVQPSADSYSLANSILEGKPASKVVAVRNAGRGSRSVPV